jgi:hypothetical protein
MERARTSCRRTIAAICLIAVLVPVNAGAAAPPKKTFKAETEGSPQPTIRGSWNEEMSSPEQARLTFEGGHAAGEYTTFEATWISPPSTSSKKPLLSVDYELTYSNAAGDDISLVQYVRARFRRGKWGRWVPARMKIPAGESDTVRGPLQMVVPVAAPDRVIFQWKIVGKIVAPAAIKGDFRPRVS